MIEKIIKTNVQKEIISILILILINVVLLLFISSISFLINYIPTYKNWKYFILLYFILLTIFYVIGNRFKNKIISYVFIILALPFILLYFIGTIGIPFMMLQVHLILYLALCFAIPTLTYNLYEYLGYPPISAELKVYLILSVSVICSVIFQRQIKFLVHKFSPARLKTSEKLRPYNIEELSNYLLSENNIKFVVFVVYFTIIVIVNYFNFKGSSYYNTEKIDKAVLQSFVTYIAFDRIISSLKQVEFKPTEMISKMAKSISAKMEQLDKIKK
jgi:hypothetical protein